MAIERTDLLSSTIVSYPNAIPTKAWLAGRLLWAERVGTILPRDGAFPQSDEDRLVLNAIEKLSEGPEPLFVEFNVDIAKCSQRMIREILSSFGLPAASGEAWMFEAGLRAENGDDVEVKIPAGLDRNSVIYSGKMPSTLAVALANADFADAHDDGRWLEMRSPEEAMKLLSILARYAKPRARGTQYPMILDASTNEALAATTTPTGSGGIDVLCLDIPLMSNVSADIELDRVLDFRSSDANDRARREYLGSASAAIRSVQSLRSDDPKYLSSVIEKLNSDMTETAKIFRKRVVLCGLAASAAYAVGAIIVPLMGGVDAAALAAAASSGVGMGAGALVVKMNKTEAEGYIGAMRRGGITPA